MTTCFGAVAFSVPRATIGSRSSEETVVSVNVAVSVCIAASAAWPRAKSASRSG